MSDIILYIGIIVVSGIVGSRVRAYRDKLGWTGTIQTMAIVLLVLLMGARMGANEEIIANLGTIGLASFVMTIAMMLGSLIFLFLARKALGFTKDAQIAALHSEELRLYTLLTLGSIGLIAASLMVQQSVPLGKPPWRRKQRQKKAA